MKKENFRNRIDTQREVLELVNRKPWKEELFGLSEQAINRWRINNNIPNDIFSTIREISRNLFLLGVRSQEQITEEYSNLSLEVTKYINKLNKLLSHPYDRI